MLLYKNKLLNISKNRVTSGGSRKKTKIKFNLLLNSKPKPLSTRTFWRSGISNLGRRTVLSKGKRVGHSKVLVYQRKHLDKSLHFHHSHFFSLSTKSIYALIFSSSGKMSYVRSLCEALPFQLLKTKTACSVFNDNSNILGSSYHFIKFSIISNMILYAKFMSKVSNLQLKMNSEIKYSKSSGSHSIILKKNAQLASSIIKLPSGVRKIFSSLSLCTPQNSIAAFNNFMFDSSSKNLIRRGIAARSRGVAKNPVDHPHGGRTKALRYPRTPWGKTTKFK